MEDFGSHKDCFAGDSNMAAFGIYDGHLGSACASYLSKSLIKALEKAYPKYSSKKKLPDKYFEEVFKQVNDKFDIERYPSAGACGAVCLLRKEGDKKVLYSANAGDAGVLISEGKRAFRLSYWHNVDNKDEVK